MCTATIEQLNFRCGGCGAGGLGVENSQHHQGPLERTLGLNHPGTACSQDILAEGSKTG